MGLLAHLPAPCFHIDATPSPEHVGTRVCQLLAKKVFKVGSAHVEKAELLGMEHLSGVPNTSKEECIALAHTLGLKFYDAETESGIQRLHRLACIH